jgi:nitroreductase
MDVREALYTTRAMRRVSTEPIPMDVQARIMDAAVRAPSGGNTQNWRFLLVDDSDVKGQIAPIYRRSMDAVWANARESR